MPTAISTPALPAARPISFNHLIEQRLQGTPVAYLTGTKEFWSLNFKVTPNTLIPRPDTELLVEFVLERFSDKQELKLLDLGTGSGAIAIALASEKPNWEVTATDFSDKALTIAQENAQLNNVTKINLLHSNWFEQHDQQCFDIIISNPPYIAEQDKHLTQGDVRFEPLSALASGKTGMDDIEHITSQAEKHLNLNGWLIFEHGYDQKQQVYDCLHRHHFQKITQLNDLSGHPRITAASR